MCNGRNTENDKFEFDNLFLENCKEVVLGVTIVNKLTFDSHIKNTWCIVENNELSQFKSKKPDIKWNDKISLQLLPFNPFMTEAVII